MTVSYASRIIIPSDVLVRELDGQSVILNLDSEHYFGLDETGTRMFQLLSSQNSIQAAFDILVDEYDVDEATLRRDLQSFVEELVRHGLAEISAE